MEVALLIDVLTQTWKRLLTGENRNSVLLKDPINPRLSLGDSYPSWSKKNSKQLLGLEEFSVMKDSLYEDVCEDVVVGIYILCLQIPLEVSLCLIRNTG